MLPVAAGGRDDDADCEGGIDADGEDGEGGRDADGEDGAEDSGVEVSESGEGGRDSRSISSSHSPSSASSASELPSARRSVATRASRRSRSSDMLVHITPNVTPLRVRESSSLGENCAPLRVARIGEKKGTAPCMPYSLPHCSRPCEVGGGVSVICQDRAKEKAKRNRRERQGYAQRPSSHEVVCRFPP
jgi:hypothetical protein